MNAICFLCDVGSSWRSGEQLLHGEQCKGQVRGNEVGGKVLFRVEEDVPGEEDQDDGDHDDDVPGSGGFAVGTRPVRQISAVHALESHPLVETDV